MVALQNLAAVSNCFRGRLPSNICNASALVSLALDGLSTASSCRHKLFAEWTGES